MNWKQTKIVGSYGMNINLPNLFYAEIDLETLMNLKCSIFFIHKCTYLLCLSCNYVIYKY